MIYLRPGETLDDAIARLHHVAAVRSGVRSALPAAYDAAKKAAAAKKRGQRSLLDDDEAAQEEAAPPAFPEVDRQAVIAMLVREKKALGFYMSGHPLMFVGDALDAHRTHACEEVEGLDDGTPCTLGGLVVGYEEHTIKNGKNKGSRMARFTIEDTTGQVGAIMWPRDLEFLRGRGKRLADEWTVWLRGRVDRTREPAGVVINDFKTYRGATQGGGR